MLKLSLYFGLGLLLCCNATEIGGRIIGGRVSQPEDAIAVAIYSLRASDDQNAYLTSGVAITPKVVLGAAQAVRTIIGGNLVTFQSHIIGFDSIFMDDQMVVEVERVVVHKNYSASTLQYNIAAFHIDEYFIPITQYVSMNFEGTNQFPNAVKVLGYGAPNELEQYSRELRTTIARESVECASHLNSLLYGPTNRCIRTENHLAQSDQGGPITNSWLTTNQITLFSLVSYWIESEPNIVVLTNLKHPDIEEFIQEQVVDDEL